MHNAEWRVGVQTCVMQSGGSGCRLGGQTDLRFGLHTFQFRAKELAAPRFSPLKNRGGSPSAVRGLYRMAAFGRVRSKPSVKGGHCYQWVAGGCEPLALCMVDPFVLRFSLW